MKTSERYHIKIVLQFCTLVWELRKLYPCCHFNRALSWFPINCTSSQLNIMAVGWSRNWNDSSSERKQQWCWSRPVTKTKIVQVLHEGCLGSAESDWGIRFQVNFIIHYPVKWVRITGLSWAQLSFLIFYVNVVSSITCFNILPPIFSKSADIKPAKNCLVNCCGGTF